MLGMRSKQRGRRVGAVAGMAVLVSIGAIASPAGAGSSSGSRVIAVFSGTVKGIVEVIDLGGDDGRVRITMASTPSGVTRVVGATVPCGTPLTPETRAFSLNYTKIEFVRATEAGLLPGGVSGLKSIRLVRPGSPATQVACRTAKVYGEELGVATGPALELENTLVSSYSFASGRRGHLVVGPANEDTVRVVGVFQRNESNLIRLVGSTEPCGSTHQSNETVFIVNVGANVYADGGIEHEDTWQNLKSLRLFKGSGFGKPAGCIQDQITVLNQLV